MAQKKTDKEGLHPLTGQPEIKLNRRERKRKLKFMLVEFKKHNARKPTIDVTIRDEKKQVRQVNTMQAWATRYGIILKQLTDLGYDFEKDSERIHKRSVEQGKAATKELGREGSVKVGDMQLMPDPKQGKSDV
jgi:hypothetical protein